MKVSRKEHRNELSSTNELLEHVIGEIRDCRYADLVKIIRSCGEADDKKKSEYKALLPMFFPPLLFEPGVARPTTSKIQQSTGIVQFDIDDYNEARSRERISKLRQDPNVIYAFLSPTYGVKFGVLTDFCCNQSSSIKDTYKQAYYITKARYDALLDHPKFDDGCHSIYLGCYLSSDGDVYFNQFAETLAVTKDICEPCDDIAQNISPKKQKSRPEISENSAAAFRPQEVLEWLEAIPNDLPYDDRLPVNFAVISYFGTDAKDILLNHWSSVDDQSKLENDIDQQIRDFKGEISASTLLYLATAEYGYVPPESRKPQPSANTPTFSAERFLGASDCRDGLIDIVRNNFFKNRQNTAVLVEAGAGKTAVMIQEVANFMLANRSSKISIFLKTEEQVNEFCSRIGRHMEDYNAALRKNVLGAEFFDASMSFMQAPHKIRGMQKLCHRNHPPHLLRELGTSLCQNCPDFDICDYQNQFGSDSISNLRVYTYNRLFRKPKFDRGRRLEALEDDTPKYGNPFKPDFIVIDEDIVNTILNVDETVTTFDIETPLSSIRKIVANLYLDRELSEAVAGLGDELKSDLHDVEANLSMLGAELSGKMSSLLGAECELIELRKLRKAYERLRATHEALNELILLECGSKRQSKHLWVQPGDGGSKKPLLIFGKKRELLPEFQCVPILYLDASGEKDVIEAAVGREFYFERLRVKQQDNAKVYQFVGKRTFSRGAHSNKRSGPCLMKSLCDWAQTLDTKSLGLIRYKSVSNSPDFFVPIDELVCKINSASDELPEAFIDEGELIGTFGAIRGLDKWSECDTLIVLGRYQLPDFAIANFTQLLFREDVADSAFCGHDHAIHQRLPLKKTIRMKNGLHQECQRKDYVDEKARLVSNHFDKGETYQAIHRLRLIHGDSNKVVYYLGNDVVDVSIDELLDGDSEFNEKNIQFLSALKRKKIIDDSVASFQSEFNWSATSVKSFRLKTPAGSMKWLLTHRSVRHWNYRTTNGKKGKLLTWHDQTDADILAWLALQGIEVEFLMRSEIEA